MVAVDAYLGVDLGTSGCRAVAIDGDATVLARAEAELPASVRTGDGGAEQNPEDWWTAVRTVLRATVTQLDRARLAGLSIDGTSGSLVVTDREGTPLTPGLMYDDARARPFQESRADLPPAAAPALGATSSRTKLLWLHRRGLPRAAAHALHQAEWLAGRLVGRYDMGDENNCLKLGYDPMQGRWPDWLRTPDFPRQLLPRVVPVGSLVGTVEKTAAGETGMPAGLPVFAGTTDSTAAALAAGIAQTGDAVTSLGSTLAIKIVAERPVYSAAHGVYSHRLFGRWLAGGASNTGGAVLLHFFSTEEMADLTPCLRPEVPTGLDYYPLLRPGERFPVSDPRLAPRVAPVPEDRVLFFQALLEGIARIERQGYRVLEALGAPTPRKIFSAGGGAHNAPWRRIREDLLEAPVLLARHAEAAVGAALVARHGALSA